MDDMEKTLGAVGVAFKEWGEVDEIKKVQYGCADGE